MAQSSDEIFAQVQELISPFNAKGVALERGTRFGADLELDSLTVMDLLAAIEDHFDVTVPLNMLPDLETVGQISDAIQNIIDQ